MEKVSNLFNTNIINNNFYLSDFYFYYYYINYAESVSYNIVSNRMDRKTINVVDSNNNFVFSIGDNSNDSHLTNKLFYAHPSINDLTELRETICKNLTKLFYFHMGDDGIEQWLISCMKYTENYLSDEVKESDTYLKLYLKLNK